MVRPTLAVNGSAFKRSEDVVKITTSGSFEQPENRITSDTREKNKIFFIVTFN